MNHPGKRGSGADHSATMMDRIVSRPVSEPHRRERYLIKKEMNHPGSADHHGTIMDGVVSHPGSDSHDSFYDYRQNFI